MSIDHLLQTVLSISLDFIWSESTGKHIYIYIYTIPAAQGLIY